MLPNLLPAILSGAALSFARAVGEFGSVVLIAGNIPFKTQVASVYIFSQVESDDPAGAAAVSVVLLVISLAVLLRDLDRSGGAAMIAERRSAHRPARRRARLPRAAAARARRHRLLPDLRARASRRSSDSVTTPAAVSAFWLTIEIAVDRGAAQHDLRRRRGARARARALPRQGAARRGHRPAVRALAGRHRPRAAARLRATAAGSGCPSRSSSRCPGMVLATIFVSLPFVVREVAPVLREIGDEQEQAAATLGASPLADVPAHHAARDPLGPRLRRRADDRPRDRRVRRGQRRLGPHRPGRRRR